jgi:CRP-like cAMP-binding protein
MTDLDQRVSHLQQVWLFSSCTDDELSRIAGLFNSTEATSGTQLCTQGEDGDEFYVVIDGTAEAVVDGDKMAELGPGSFFGEMALIDGGERTASVTATSPMKLLVLNRNDFNTMLSSAMPHIAPKLMEVMGQRIRELARHAGNALPY